MLVSDEPFDLGDQRWALLEGDSLAILPRIPDGTIDALVTDAPYSSGGMVRGDRMGRTTEKYVGTGSSNKALAEFGGDNRDQRSFGYWCTLWLSEARRVTRPGGLALLFTDWRQLPTTTDALQSGGWVWRGIVPWAKPTSRPQIGRFRSDCEYVVWGSNGAMSPNHEVGVLPGFYTYSAPRHREHITQKPVALMRDLLKIVTPGGVVLDPFVGSGTTGIAAMHEGLRFIGCEMIKAHADTARRRIAQAAGEQVDDPTQCTLV